MPRLSCRQRIRRFVSLQKAKLHYPRYSHLGGAKAGPSKGMAEGYGYGDGGPLFIAKSMQAEIEDGDDLYRTSFQSDGSRSIRNSVSRGGPVSTRTTGAVRTQAGPVVGTNDSRPQTATSRPGTANSRPPTASSRPTTAGSASEGMPGIERTESGLSKMLKRQNTNPKERPLRLLSLDGGGIRGLSSLHILRNIMKELDLIIDKSIKRPLRPCDYFDLIGGTSTGGLIAIMLGILEMDVDSCINEYMKLSPIIFPVKNFISGSMVVKGAKVISGSTQFEAAPLEAAIKQLIVKWLGKRATNGADTLMQFEDKTNKAPRCRVFVCATGYDNGQHHRLRNFKSDGHVLGVECAIWQACRATSAAPTFFEPITLGTVKLVDGGLGYNNPIRAVTNEAWDIWHGKRDIGCIISIGTGVPEKLPVGGAGDDLGKMIKYFLKTATDTEKTAAEIKRELDEKFYGKDQVYWRFNVTAGVGNIGLEEWKQSENIKIATEKYLVGQGVAVKHCAWQLQKSQNR